jgi:transporter, motA/tolQ/exbB proton channel family protein
MESFFTAFVEIFKAGGILMYPLVLLSVYLYFCGFKIFFKMRRLNAVCSDAKSFSRAYGAFLSDEFSASKKSGGDIKTVFTRLRLELLSGVERRLFMLKILSSVAPLIGLLGTVSGMMFSIASTARASGDVAAGISSALITTQAGLVVAIPAWIIAMIASAQTQTLLINLAKREAALIREVAK